MPDFGPQSFFLNICERYRFSYIEVSVYQYVPQTVADPRIVHRLGVKDFDRSFSQLYQSLASGHEIAVHSRSKRSIAGRAAIFHVPMLDLACSEIDEGQLATLEQLAFDIRARAMCLFASGRSYHVYFDAAISHQAWVRFMGRALLTNLPNATPLVDSRWIGHRLQAGFASLRWTNNSRWYVKSPQLIDGADFEWSRFQGRSKSYGRELPALVQHWLLPHA
jgi:hypothetical protein